MKPILHIVKDTEDRRALEVIARQAKDNAYGVAAIYIQKAVTLPAIPDVRTCALQEDLRGNPPGTGVESISYADLLKLIFSSEAVTIW